MSAIRKIYKSRRHLLLAVAMVALLLLGTLRTAAYAQEDDDKPAAPTAPAGGPKVTVLIDKERNAVIQLDHQKASTDGSSGSIVGGVDLGGGLSALNINADFGAAQAEKMKGAKASAFGQIDTSSTAVLGNFTVPLPASSDKPAKLVADAKVQQNDKNVHADIKVNGQFPNPGNMQLTKLAIDGTSKTDYKTLTSNVKVDIGAAAMAQVPVKSFDLTVTEPDANSTSLDLVLGFDLQSPMGQRMKPQFDQIKANPKQTEDMVKGMLANYGVESVTIKYEDANNEGKLSVSMKATGLRGKISDYVQKMASSMPQGEGSLDPNVIKQSTDNMLQFSFNKLNINAKFAADLMNLTVTVDAKNFDKFLTGYTALMANLQEANFKRMQSRSGGDQTTGLALKWWHAVQSHINDLQTTMMTEMITANVTVTQSLKFNMDVKDNVTIDGTYVQDANNFDKVFSALKAKGFPVADGGGLVVHIKGEGTQATGSFYLAAKGNLPQIAKSLFVDPAKNDPELKPAADLLNNLTWQDGRMQLQLNDTKLQFSGYTKTSDVTPLIMALQMKAMPNLIGTPTGGRLEVTMKDNSETSAGRLGFKGFEQGKSNDEVKALVSSMFNATDVTVNDSADAAQTTLAKLDQPKIEMPAELASVKSEGETTVAAVPAPGTMTAGGPGAGPGGMNMGVMIGIGIAVVALLGIVMASAGKKK